MSGRSSHSQFWAIGSKFFPAERLDLSMREAQKKDIDHETRFSSSDPGRRLYRRVHSQLCTCRSRPWIRSQLLLAQSYGSFGCTDPADGHFSKSDSSSACRTRPSSHHQWTMRVRELHVVSGLPLRYLALTVAAVLLAGIAPAGAQQQAVPNPDRLRMEAPVGHRQPRPSELPPRVLQQEKHLPADSNRFDLDSELNICRGC
jgi:hypothetical protein